MLEKCSTSYAIALTGLLRLKGCISLWETYRIVPELHLPYGITQCCLPSDTGQGVSPSP